MKSRHFSLDQLLKQLQADEVKIPLSDEELTLLPQDKSKLLEQKRQQLLQAIQTSIKTHGGSRIFELPDAIDCLYVDAEADSKKLIGILLSTPADEIFVDEGIPHFTYSSSTPERIKAWSKDIMRHAAQALLTTDNEIQPGLLKHFEHAPGSLTSADLILSFFTYNSMQISKLLHPYRFTDTNQQEINEHLYNIFIAYDDCVKDATIWSEEVLEDRKPGSKQNQTSGRTAASISRKTGDSSLSQAEKIGLGIAGGVAALFVAGMFGLAGFAISNQHNSPGPRPPGK